MSIGPTDEAVEGAAGVSGEVLGDPARTLHLQFDYPGSMKAYERPYAAYRREGKTKYRVDHGGRATGTLVGYLDSRRADIQGLLPAHTHIIATPAVHPRPTGVTLPR